MVCFALPHACDAPLPLPGDETAMSECTFFHKLAAAEYAPACPKCAEEHIYGLSEGRMRCGACRYTFHTFTGTWLNTLNLGCDAWFEVLQGFVAGQPTSHVARLAGCAAKTARRACTVIRLALASQREDAHLFVGMDEGGVTRGPRAFCPGREHREDAAACGQCVSPVFAVTEDASGVHIVHREGVMAREVFGYPLALKNWRGLVHTDAFAGADGLLFACCATARDVYAHKFTNEGLKLDRTGFKSFVEASLQRHRHLDPQHVGIHLVELAHRYSLDEERFLLLCGAALASPVPQAAVT